MPQRHQMLLRDRHGFERTLMLNRPVTLGRQNQCDIVLTDSMISRAHLRIEKEDGQWWVEDLKSSHGSFMDDNPITRVPWKAGETIRLADGAYFITLKSETHAVTEVNMQAILQTAQLLAEDAELDDILDQSLERLLVISGTDRGFIMLLEGGELVAKVQRGLGQKLESSIQLSMSSVHSVFERGEPTWIHNVSDHEKLMSQKSILDLQLKTILCLPLTSKGKRIGVVYLDSKRIITEPMDRPIFEAIVSLCAIAIERARLSEDNLRNQVLATVGQVASSIVHDFKNALFVVRGHAELLEVLNPNKKSKHHVSKILEAVQRLGEMSTDVLDYAKVREPRREKVDLTAFLSNLVEAIRPHAKDMGVAITCEDIPCAANLDPARFARVIENLLANALDAVAEKLGERKVSLTWERVTGGVQIRVTDNGKGIPRKILRRIFEPFFSYGKNKGTGLGMATVKKIIEEHGGSIEVQSEEGEGTMVILTIPDHVNAKENTGGHSTTGQKKSLRKTNPPTPVPGSVRSI